MRGVLSETGQETKQIACSFCKVRTHHTLRARYSWLREIRDSVDEGVGEVIGTCEHRYSVWMCGGCDTVTFESQMIYGDGTEGDGGFFSTREVQPKLYRKLNPELTRLYGEIVACFDKGYLLLCTIGLRALIEGICIDKGLKDGKLDQKIEGLIKLLPSVNVIEALHECRVAGNYAAHRLEALSRDETELAIDVIEGLLNFLYDLDYKASQVRNTLRRTAFKSVSPGSVQ